MAAFLPTSYWPTVDEMPKLSNNTISYKESAPDRYDFTYNRTGRSMGAGQGYNGGFMNPNYLDNLLDAGMFLDMADPNRYHYNLRDNRTQATQLSPLGLTRLSTPQAPVSTGVEAEKAQQNNPLYEALLRMYTPKQAAK